MKSLVFKDWTLDIDYESTINAYKAIKVNGSINQCDCIECSNFRSAKERVFPLLILDLFESIGIDFESPAEIYHNCRTKPGFHNYGGWFHFIGDFQGEDIYEPLKSGKGGHLNFKEITPEFSIGFSKQIACLDQEFEEAFKDKKIVQLEFFNELVPWVIGNEEPE